MKNLFVLLLCVLFVSFCACDASTKEIDVYSGVIENLGNNTFYALYDLDGNGTKELLLGFAVWGDIVCPYLVFSIQNGVAVRQEAYLWFEGNGPAPIVFGTGTIRVELSDDVGSRFYYFKMDEGELVFWINLIVDNGVYDWDSKTYHDEYFLLNPDADKRVSITQGEFGRLQKELEGDGAPAKLDWKPRWAYWLLR
jgi:hypothetical protein